MAVPFTRLESEALDSYGSKDAFDNLMRYDGIIEGLGGNEGIKFEEGGQPNFRERTLYGQNTNVAARGKNEQITTVDDDGFTLISVPQRIVDGSIVYNQQELDQVQGDPSLAPGLIEDKIVQFNSSWVQVIADLIRQAVPGAKDPFTLLPSGTTGTVNGILIARTPTQQGTDAATTAGISRGDNSWWRNQYSNTSYDLTTTGGRRGLHLDVYAACTRGNSAMFEPNIGICSTVALSSLGAAADNNRRGTYSDANGNMKLGYDNIMFYNARLVRDSSSRFLNGSAGKIAFINSRALKIKVLKGQGKVQKEMLDQKNNLKSLPIFWKHKNMSDIDSLNYVTIGYLTFNLVPKSLQDHGLADNLS